MKIICIKRSYIKLLLILTLVIFFDITFVYIKSNSVNYSDNDIYLIQKYKQKKLLALTFDDGPSKYTNELLDTLNSENVKVTFFVLGENIIKNNENILLKEYEAGQLVCIHSYKHVFFTKISKEAIVEQISMTKNIIYNITSYTPSYIRVPYGILNDKVRSVLKEENLENILWNVDSLDWKYKNTNKTVEHIITETSGNDIILMHDTSKTSIDSAKQIIRYFKEKGFEFVTVYELNRIKNMAKSLN